MFVNFFVRCNPGENDDQVLRRFEQYLRSGQSAADFYRVKPNADYAFIVVDIDIAQEETLLQQHGVLRAHKQPSMHQISAFERHMQQRTRAPIRSQPQLTVLVVHGDGLPTCDYIIMGWFRQFGPFVNITRETPDTAFITMLQGNALALLEESRRGNVTWPSELRLELNSEARPADPSVRINGVEVCCAYLHGHCRDNFLLCPFALSHPLHECGIDYEGALLSHSSSSLKRKSPGAEDGDAAGEFDASTFPIS